MAQKPSSDNRRQTMSETAQAERFGAREGAAVRAWVAAHWFGLGVAAIAAAAAAFLFHQLLAWPPHEDETLPLFVGRHPLGELFQVVLEERGGAPLHFLLAWVVAHLGLRPRRSADALGALRRREPPGRRAARGAPRRARCNALIATVIVAASWTFLFHGDLRPDVQPLPLHERALVSRAAARARAWRTGGRGRSGRSRSSRPSRRTRTARSCSRRRGSSSSSPAATGCGRRSGPSAPSPCSGFRSG